MDLSFHPETKQILRRTTKSPLTLLQLHFVFKIGRSNGFQTNRYHEKGYLVWVWIPRWFSCWSSPRVFSFPSTRLLLSTTGVVTTNVVHKEVEGDTRKLTTLVAVSRIISKQVKTLSATLRSLGDGIDSQVMLEAKCPYKWYREWDVEQYIQCGWMVPFLQELMELSTTRLASISSA